MRQYKPFKPYNKLPAEDFENIMAKVGKINLKKSMIIE